MTETADTPAADTASAEGQPGAKAADAKTYYLVDGSGFIFRAFHALPMMTRKADGMPVNAVYGFTNMVLKLLADLKADHVAVVFDAARENFRNAIYADYKANRDEPPEELKPQFELIRAATEAFSLPLVEKEGFEADDIIATYCAQARAEGAKVVIVSSDKDLMQLVGGGVTMLDPMKNIEIDVPQVVEKWGVEPAMMVDLQALAGDSTDNVPGVPGIGPKTAAQLLEQYGTLENLLDHAEEIKQPKRRQALIDNAELARISKQLVRLVADVDLPVGLADVEIHKLDAQRLIGFLKEMDFRSTLTRVEAQLLGEGAAAELPDAAATASPDKAEYVLIQDAETLQDWMDRAVEAGILAVDTETDSLSASRARLVGVSLAITPGRAAYVPLAHAGAAGAGTLALDDGDGPPEQIPLDDALAILKPVLEDPSVLKIGHNFKYDWQVLIRHGIRVTPTDDTMLMSYVLDGGAHGHGMDELADLHLGHKTIKYSDVCGSGKSAITFDRVALDKARDYAAEDADITLRLHALLKPRLPQERLTAVYELIERPLVAVIGEMEWRGVKVDRSVLARLSKEFAEKLEGLETEIHQLAGHAFNVGSPKQLATVLFEEMGLEGGKKGKGGTYSTDSSVLEGLSAKGHPIAEKVLDWRQLSKLKGTYTDALQEVIHPETGRIHTSFSLAATNTGRLSSNEPNLQNIPIRTEAGRQIRTAFVAEPGNKLISIDYSQIELRLVAHVAGIELLKQAFRDGIDIHAMTASQVFGVPLEEMTPETRRRAKAINFGIIYGISGWGLAQQLGIDQGEATRFIKAYLERFHELKAWMDQTKKGAKEHGYVETLFGRRVHVPGIKDPNPARRGFAERQAINAPIQGTAADIIKRAMIRIPDALAREQLDAWMLLQVHDELLFEAPADQADRTVEVVRGVMERAAVLSVPLVAEAGIGDDCGAAH
ncbi:MAG: DNA polymerase I [Alphaproteobacteria bacterium]|nr:DNA polymerase I [Alphaproteobacteria bacterium]